jgi:heptosyltransferase-2
MNILVSKVNFLGDAVVFLPTLYGLVENIKDCNLYVITTPIGKEVIEGAIPVEDFFIYDYTDFRKMWKNPVKLYKFVSYLKEKNFEMACFSYDEPSTSYLAVYLAGIKRRIGFDNNIAKLNFLLNERIKFEFHKNVVDINFDLVRYITGKYEIKPQRVPIKYYEKDKEKVDSILQKFGILENDKFVVIHPFAKFNYREWFLSRYFALAELIERKIYLPVIFITEKPQDIFNKNGKRSISGLTIKELAYLISRAALFIGNNSGPMHIAGVMGTPTLIIQGPSAPQWSIYWDGIHYKVTAQLPCVPCERIGYVPMVCYNEFYPLGCMKEISVEMVFAKVCEILQKLEK